MTRRPRRHHTPVFKAKVALAAIKGEKTLGRSDSNWDSQESHPHPITDASGKTAYFTSNVSGRRGIYQLQTQPTRPVDGGGGGGLSLGRQAGIGR